ncbi:MAG TPA: choice-of-anchor B family protein, partial [bacterium]|nr:choice-of-anchor B family protein [bacterium]
SARLRHFVRHALAHCAPHSAHFSFCLPPMRAFLSVLLSALLLNGPLPACAQRPHAALNMELLGQWHDPAPDTLPNHRYNDIWGYAAPDSREYAIVGSRTGTHFIDVTNPRTPRLIRSVPGRAPADWRDFKTYSHYAYAVADGSPSHSLQIFDLQYLPDSVHLVLDSDTMCPAAHTCFIEGDRLYLVAVERPNELSPFHDIDIYSLADPERPRRLSTLFLGPYAGAAHAVFARHDTLYASGSYGGLFIFDVRQPASPRLLLNLSRYPYAGYNHSSWSTASGRLMVIADEVPGGLPLKLYDLSDLSRPRLLSTFNSHPYATPHNPYLVGDRYVVASWYQDGVQVWDVADPLNPRRTGFFDTYPDNDSSLRPLSNPGAPPYGYTGLHGCWGVYPFLPSGTIVASDRKHGLFALSPPYPIPVPLPPGAPSPQPVHPAPIGLWPNPTTGEVTLSLRYASAHLTIEVLSALGQRVRPHLSWSKPTGPVTVPLAGLAPGTYWLRICRTNDVPHLERIVISP